MRIILLSALALTGCSLTSPSLPLKADPNWHVDQLPNGMKYHIYPTADQAVSVRLVVNVGSFQENPSQKGYAHFIEHMAFNGSQHFSGNDVIKMFEQSGGSFGADINAFTSYQQTTYKLDLPNDDMLNQALTWMRDISDGIKFEPSQVTSEKGVIMSEWRRTRPNDAPFSLNAYEASIAGTRYADHDPLGTPESIKGATAVGLENFYQKWYQPQYAELIVAGDVDVEQLSENIKKQFANWQNNNETKLVKHRDLAVNSSNEILPSSSVESPSLHYTIDRGFISQQTRQQQHQAWHDTLSAQLIQQRLVSVLRDSAMPFQYSYAQPLFSNYSRLSTADLSFAPELREKMHALFISTLTSLRDHGVTQDEFATIMAGFENDLNNINSDWDQRTPMNYVDHRVFELEQNSVSQSKEDFRASLAKFIKNNTLKTANKNLKSLLSAQPAFVIGMGPNETKQQFSDIFTTLNRAYAQDGEKILATTATSDGFIKPSGDGQILDIRKHAGGFIVFTLSNGIDVWFQQDKTAGKRIFASYASEGGKASLTQSLYPAVELAFATAMRSGLGKLSGTELDSYLRQRNIAISPLLGLTQNGLHIVSDKQHFADALAVLYNAVTDIKVDPRQLEAAKDEFIQNREVFLHSPLGKLAQSANAKLYTSDSYHRLISGSEVASVTPEQILAVHNQLFKHNHGMKMVIVADLEPHEIIPLLRKYVASIELEQTPTTTYSPRYKKDLPNRLVLDESQESSSLYLMYIANLQPQKRTTKDIFVEDLLSRISTARILSLVREDAGLDYQPNIYPAMKDSENDAIWCIEAQLAPTDVAKIDAQIGKLTDGLIHTITQQEVDTASKQILADIKKATNDPNMRTLIYSRYLIHGYDIDKLLNIDDTLQGISLQDVQRKAKYTFGEHSKRTVFILNPKA
ncbi:peptidase M16 [Photobacterium aquae]|uniref:Peptidase M16 n=2 Tax=Photobacterium aquae TaxID=1195763 RepID=A0A0J1JQU7_9GAMM|nr:peptidase M16 [Photobacterium aquae]